MLVLFYLWTPRSCIAGYKGPVTQQRYDITIFKSLTRSSDNELGDNDISFSLIAISACLQVIVSLSLFSVMSGVM